MNCVGCRIATRQKEITERKFVSLTDGLVMVFVVDMTFDLVRKKGCNPTHHKVIISQATPQNSLAAYIRNKKSGYDHHSVRRNLAVIVRWF